MTSPKPARPCSSLLVPCSSRRAGRPHVGWSSRSVPPTGTTSQQKSPDHHPLDLCSSHHNGTTSTPITGRVICDAQAAECQCHKTAGHLDDGDPIHSCDPRLCSGSWTGDYDDEDTFRPLTLPRRVAVR